MNEVEPIAALGIDIQGAYEAYNNAHSEAVIQWGLFMTPQHLSALQTFSQDGGIQCRLAHADEDIPIAAIYLETNGHIVIHPAVFLACIHETHGFNRAILNFIIGHEIGHFLDMYSINGKPTYFDLELESLDAFFERQNVREQAMWNWYCTQHSIDDPQALKDELNVADERSPFATLYHEFFNKLDDTIVNEYGLVHSKIDEKPGRVQATCNRSNLSEIYRHSLFPEPKNTPPDFENFGNYILSQIMDSTRTQHVSEAVRNALQTRIQIEGTNYTILEAQAHFTRHYTKWYGAKRYLQYERGYIAAFEELLKTYLQQTSPAELKQYIQSRPRTDTSSHADTKPLRKSTKNKASQRSKEAHAKAKSTNKNQTTSDSTRIHEAVQSAAKSFANEHGVNQNAAADYMQACLEINEVVENYAQQLCVIIKRKMQKKQMTTIKKTSDGTLHMPTVTQNVGHIISGQLASLPPLHTQKFHTDVIIPTPIQLSIDLALDNSGSTQPFVAIIQKNCVLLEKVCMRAKEILQKDGFTDVTLDVNVHLFGNTSRTIKQAKKNTKENEIELIRAFPQITCNEGTQLAALAQCNSRATSAHWTPQNLNWYYRWILK
jgi:hypothetical protein